MIEESVDKNVQAAAAVGAVVIVKDQPTKEKRSLNLDPFFLYFWFCFLCHETLVSVVLRPMCAASFLPIYGLASSFFLLISAAAADCREGGGTNISSSCRPIPISPLSLFSVVSSFPSIRFFISSHDFTATSLGIICLSLVGSLTALCFGLYKAPAQSQQSNCFRGASFFLFSFPLCVARLLGPIISLPKSRAELKKQRREILTGEIEEIGKAKKHTREKSNTHLPDGSYP
jgi:hypothetical protein